MDTRRATDDSVDVLDSTSRSPTERNAVDMRGFDGRGRGMEGILRLQSQYGIITGICEKNAGGSLRH